MQEKTQSPNLHGHSKMLVIFIDEEDRIDHRPLHEAIVRQLRKSDIAGATVLRGIMGYGAQHRITGSGTLGIPEGRPITIIAVDDEAKIVAALPEIEPMVREGLIVLVDAFVRKYSAGPAQSRF